MGERHSTKSEDAEPEVSAVPRTRRGGPDVLGTTVDGRTSESGADFVLSPPVRLQPVAPPVPTSIGRYEVTREIGRGRFGVVYEALDPALNRSVAVKVARPEFAMDAEFVDRFAREAADVARLDHPGIVGVFDVGTDESSLFFAMELCAGSDMAEWLETREQPVEPRLAAELVRQVAVAVHRAHQLGVVHRDLKPANLVLSPVDEPGEDAAPWRVRVLDFGVARSLGDELSDTRTSLVVGTPLYMAPEQALAEGVDARTDVFSIGAILYELLTGRPPFPGEHVSDIFGRLETCETPAPSTLRPDVPADLETICLRCLQRFPEDRYQSAGELAADLRRFVDGEPIAARPIRPWNGFFTWLRSSDRLREFGRFVTIVSVFVIAWSWLAMGLGAVLDDVRDAMAGGDLRKGLLFMVAATIPNLFLVLVGWRSSQSRVTRLELWAGLAFTGALGAKALSVQLHLSAPPTPWYEDHPVAMQFVHLGITLVMLAQSMAFVVLLLSHRWQRAGMAA